MYLVLYAIITEKFTPDKTSVNFFDNFYYLFANVLRFVFENNKGHRIRNY